jgi:hypothetical protein
MGCTGACNDEVNRIEGDVCPVRIADRDLRPRHQRGTRLLRQARIDLDRGDLSCPPDEFGHERSIIAGAAAEMQGLLADGNVEVVEQKGP